MDNDYPSGTDFIADLSYLTTAQGGRRTPFSGYRPQIKFHFSEMQTSGQQTFLDRQTVLPGGLVKAAIAIISKEYFREQLTEGLPFHFLEGSRLIGTGIITRIINKELLKPE